MITQTPIPDGLYHKELGLPPCGQATDRLWKLEYSHHAKYAAVTDRYGVVKNPPTHLNISKSDIVEAEFQYGQLVKVVVRLSGFVVNNQCDLVMVISPIDTSRACVRTLWLNKTSDKHSTLRHGAYRKYKA